MFLLTDINFILLFIVFIIRMNILTNQQFIPIVNDNRSKFNKFIRLFDRRTIMFPINSTFKKHFSLNNHQIYLSISRKRRSSIHEFKSESIKYFTCAMVKRSFRQISSFL
jgi:hypothetical protein